MKVYVWGYRGTEFNKILFDTGFYKYDCFETALEEAKLHWKNRKGLTEMPLILPDEMQIFEIEVKVVNTNKW